MAPGRRSKTELIAFSSTSSATVPVPNVSTNSPTGCAAPIA
jgi:hypothetical protein